MTPVKFRIVEVPIPDREVQDNNYRYRYYVEKQVTTWFLRRQRWISCGYNLSFISAKERLFELGADIVRKRQGGVVLFEAEF